MIQNSTWAIDASTLTEQEREELREVAPKLADSNKNFKSNTAKYHIEYGCWTCDYDDEKETITFSQFKSKYPELFKTNNMNKLELIIEARKEFAEKIANIIGEPIEIEATNITGLSEETALELYAQTKGYLNVTDFYRESEYQWFEMKNHNLSFDVKSKNK